MTRHIQYRGYCRGPQDTGCMTATYPTEAEALDRAKACCFVGDTAWTLPEFTGPLDTTLKALVPLKYIEWKPSVKAMTIPAGASFKAGDVLAADHHTTRATIGLWVVQGKAAVMPSPAEREKAQRIAFVTRKVGRRVPHDEAWLEAFEAEHGAVSGGSTIDGAEKPGVARLQDTGEIDTGRQGNA